MAIAKKTEEEKKVVVVTPLGDDDGGRHGDDDEGTTTSYSSEEELEEHEAQCIEGCERQRQPPSTRTNKHCDDEAWCNDDLTLPAHAQQQHGASFSTSSEFAAGRRRKEDGGGNKEWDDDTTSRISKSEIERTNQEESNDSHDDNEGDHDALAMLFEWSVSTDANDDEPSIITTASAADMTAESALDVARAYDDDDDDHANDFATPRMKDTTTSSGSAEQNDENETRRLCHLAHVHILLKRYSAAISYLSMATNLVAKKRIVNKNDDDSSSPCSCCRRNNCQPSRGSQTSSRLRRRRRMGCCCNRNCTAVGIIHLLFGYVLERSDRPHWLALEQYQMALPYLEGICGGHQNDEHVRTLTNHLAFLLGGTASTKDEEEEEAHLLRLENAVSFMALSWWSHSSTERRLNNDTSKNSLPWTKKGEDFQCLVTERWEEMLRQIHDIFGDDSPIMSDTRVRLGAILSSMGRHKDALRNYRRALKGTMLHCAVDDPKVKSLIEEIATEYEAIGLPRIALKRYQAKLNDIDAALCPALLNALGSICCKKNQLKEAESFFRESLLLQTSSASSFLTPSAASATDEEDTRTTLPMRADTLLQVGNMHALGKRYTLSLSYFDTALHLLEGETKTPLKQSDGIEIRSLAHHNKAAVWNSMANSQFAKGRYDNAIRLYQKSLEAHDKGMQRSQRVGTLCNLGTAHSHTGAFHEAIHDFNEALREVEEGSDESRCNNKNNKSRYNNHERKKDLAVATIQYKLGTVYAKKGDENEAREHYSIALRVYRGIFGEDNASVLRCRHDLGLLLLCRSDCYDCTSDNSDEKSVDDENARLRKASLNAGIKMLEDVRERMIRVQGPDSMDVAKVSVDLAGAYYKKGNATESQRFCDKALIILKTHHVPDTHSCYVQVRRWLSKIDLCSEASVGPRMLHSRSAKCA